MRTTCKMLASYSTNAAAKAKANINLRIHLTSFAAQTSASPGIRGE